MNLYAKVKFWSLPVIGIVCILTGGYLYPFGPEKRIWSEFLLIAGLGQLLIFVILLFFWYRKKNRDGEKA